MVFFCIKNSRGVGGGDVRLLIDCSLSAALTLCACIQCRVQCMNCNSAQCTSNRLRIYCVTALPACYRVIFKSTCTLSLKQATYIFWIKVQTANYFSFISIAIIFCLYSNYFLYTFLGIGLVPASLSWREESLVWNNPMNLKILISRLSDSQREIMIALVPFCDQITPKYTNSCKQTNNQSRGYLVHRWDNSKEWRHENFPGAWSGSHYYFTVATEACISISKLARMSRHNYMGVK